MLKSGRKNRARATREGSEGEGKEALASDSPSLFPFLARATHAITTTIEQKFNKINYRISRNITFTKKQNKTGYTRRTRSPFTNF